MKDSPRVSVVMPAYNEEKLIRRSVCSILSQSYTDFELIVVDDGSTDNTWQILNEFDDPRIRLARPGRLGFNRALNYGMSMARGEYIARMDADDESLPDRLERQVAFLGINPEISILGAPYLKYDAMRNECLLRVHPQTDQEIRRAMGFYIPICHGAVMFRKIVVDKLGGYNEDVLDQEDLELWLRAAPYFKFANLDLPPAYIYWFDPKKSFFEGSLGRPKRTWISLRLHARAIRELDLPAYNYTMLGAKFLYAFLLPNRLKRFARKLVSGNKETQVSFPGPRTDRA